MVESPHSGSLISKNLQTQTIGIINEKEKKMLLVLPWQIQELVLLLCRFSRTRSYKQMCPFRGPRVEVISSVVRLYTNFKNVNTLTGDCLYPQKAKI